MLINTDLSTDASPGSLQQRRAEASSASSQPSSNPQAGPASSQLEPSLRRLTETPSSLQDADFGIHDESGTSRAVEFLRQSMMGQPAAAMAAQANQLSQNVFSLLQSTH